MSILELFANSDERLPITCLPATVRQYAEFDVFLDIKRFPLSVQLIENIAHDFVKVNEILQSGWVNPISLTDLVVLKKILQIQDVNAMKDEIMDLESKNRSLALWLHFYLELRAPIDDIDLGWKEAYAGVHQRVHVIFED